LIIIDLLTVTARAVILYIDNEYCFYVLSRVGLPTDETAVGKFIFLYYT